MLVCNPSDAGGFQCRSPLCLQDLETRKRAPLYQKKQEEELKAACDKAIEAEVRAGEAEIAAREAKVGLFPSSRCCLA